MSIEKFHKVKSSNVIGVSYNPETQELGVAYKGGVYFYKNVKPETWEALKKAESVGKFMNSTIKPNHSFEKRPVQIELIEDLGRD